LEEFQLGTIYQIEGEYEICLEGESILQIPDKILLISESSGIFFSNDVLGRTT